MLATIFIGNMSETGCIQGMIAWHAYAFHCSILFVSMVNPYITIIPIGDGYPRTLPGRVDHLQKELKGCAVQIKALSTQLEVQDKNMSALRDEFRLILHELGQTKRAIKDVTELMKT